MGSSGYKSGKIKAFPQKVSKFFGDSKIIRTFAPPEPAKPLNDAQMCGSFYFYTMSNRVPFQKPYTNPHDLVLQLQQRGLSVQTRKAELTEEERDEVVTNCDHLQSLKFRPTLPYAFTEQGIGMLSVAFSL